ncbi:cytochrome P450 [Xylariomycetidae sp. FL2044]|nr:cytochrome P450 [Xylariomycetidae sp. FL2044]
MSIFQNQQFLLQAGFTVLTLLCYPILRAIYNVYYHPLAHVPGPRLWSASRLPFIRALLRGTIIQDFERLHQRYGPILRIAPDEVTFAQPEAWNDILLPRPGGKQFLKDPTWWASQPGMSLTILSAIQPEPHARIRKLFAPAFSPHALKAQEPFLHHYVDLLVERLKERAISSPNGQGAEVEISPWFNFTTFDIIGDLAYGESFGCLENSRYHQWIKGVYDSVKAATWVASTRFYPMVEYVLLKAISPLLQKMQRKHFEHIEDKVARRLNWEMERADFMSHVIKGGVGKTLPMDQINSTYVILTNAGSETTATALTGTLNSLVQNKDKLDNVVREVRHHFRTGEEITLEALQQLPYLNGVLKEGLRLSPPISWVLPRRVPSGGSKVCGIWLPENTRVSIQAYTMNRDPTYFHQPASFIPERWLPDVSPDPSSPFRNDRREALQPFAVGPRNCLGQHLAWAELRLILGKILYNLDFAAVPGKTVKWEDLRTFLFVEKSPIHVNVKVRD